MDSKFNKVFEEIYNEANKSILYEKEKVESKGIQKFGDVKFSSKITSQYIDGDKSSNVYHDFSFISPKKDIPLRMNWIRDLQASSPSAAISMINKELSTLDSSAVKPLTKTLEIVNKRIEDLNAAKVGIMAEMENVASIEKKYK